MGTERKIRLGSSVTIEYLVGVLFSLLDGQHVIFLGRFPLAESFLRRTLREVKVLGW